MRGKVTIQEIADLVGVSKFAVSRALSSKPGVSVQTREIILKAAGQLGYFKQSENTGQPVEPRRQRDGERSGTIVVLFPNIRFQNRESVYWGPVFDGITNRLNEEGMDILTLTEPSSDNLFSLLNPEAIRGILAIGSISTQILLDIGRLNIPVVMVDHVDSAFQCDTVFADNFNGMKEIMVKLISRGYRKYQFVGSVNDAQSFQERWMAFRMTLEEHEIVHVQDPLLISQEAGDIYKMMPKVSLDDIPEVYVCNNDATAEYMTIELGKRGIVVPEDCVVTGFDNTNEAAPILATVHVNKELLGERAVDQLLWRSDNRNGYYERKLISGRLIMREQFMKKG